MKSLAKIFLIGAIILTSCESYVTGISEDDITRATSADLKLVVVAAEINYMGFLEGQAARIAGMWSGYFRGADRQYVGYHNYDVTYNTFDSEWQNVYVYTLKQLKIAQKIAMAENNLTIKGICQVMEASIMSTATALWGDIPYREAVDVQHFPNPSYDPQDQLIDDLILVIDDALINLNSNVGIGASDFLFNGNNAQWIKVAHSVKARLLLYKKEYGSATAEATLGIQEPGDDLVALHGTSFATDINLFFDFQEISRQGTMTAESTHLGKLLDPLSAGNRNHTKTDESARLANYYMGTSEANYMPNTQPDGYFFANSPFPLHSAFETKLIAAECLLYLGDFTGALAKLNEHRDNLRQIYPTGIYTDFVATDFDPGEIENPFGDKTAEQALLFEIHEEKWVSLYGQIEGFNEIRRTGNSLGVPINLGTKFPQRFLYSLDEINGNSNTPDVIPGLDEPVAIFKQN